MKWLDDVLSSVPSDYHIDAEELPDGDSKVAALPEDLVPVMRAWVYTQDKIREAKKSGIRKSYATLAEFYAGRPVDKQAALADVETVVTDVERLERQEQALAALIHAALWDQFAEAGEEVLGATLTKDGWIVFRSHDERPQISILSLAFPMR